MQKHWSDGQVLIRPYRRSDVDALYEAVRESVKEVAHWLSWCHAGYNRAESEAWITACARAWATGESYDFGIFDAHSNIYLGGCGLNHLNHLHRLANLGYWVRTSCAGRGIASAAARLVAHFGFEELGLTRIEIVAAVDNAPSQRVAEKVGAIREGTQRNRLINDDRIDDAVMFSLIPADLGIRQKKPRD